MGMIKFNGASSKDFGVEVETFPNYVAPQKEYEAIHIPGRNGDLLIDSGTYSNVEKRYKVNMVKEPPATEVSGPIANFKSNVALPLSELKTNINPVQDLHGYSKPWIGGGGKNKLNATGTNNYTTLVDGVYTVTSAPQTGISWYIGWVDLKAGTYILNGGINFYCRCYVRAGDEYYTSQGADVSFTLTSDTTVSVSGVITPEATVGYKLKPMIRLASVSDATFEPYSNICPISGFSALNVTRTGKNRLNYDAWKTVAISKGTAVWENNGVKITATGNDAYTNFTITTFPIAARVPITEGETITLSWQETTNTSGSVVIFPNGTTSGMVVVNNAAVKKATYTATSGITFVTFRFGVANSGDTIAYKNIQIEKGSQASDYSPYNGQTASVNFGQTVYGGVADVNNGKVTITHLLKRIGDLSWFYNSNYNFFSATFSDFTNGYSELDIKSSVFESIYGRNNASMADAPNYTINHFGTTVKVKDTDYTDATAFKTALANETIWYKLATPIEITTTPENLTAISGDNNIFSDSGDVDIKTNELATTYSGKMELIANWLNSASGYARLEDSYDPDYYRLAYFNQALDIENVYDEAGRVELSFICKPQKFYKSGENPIVFTSAGRIQNRTQHAALPLLKVKTNNTDGTVSIGNSSFGISAGSGTDIIIDCELQNAYYGIENKNNYIILNDGDFPRIEPGTQVVSFTGGVQSVEVIPRWWTV